jgi:hypothetical protein
VLLRRAGPHAIWTVIGLTSDAIEIRGARKVGTTLAVEVRTTVVGGLAAEPDAGVGPVAADETGIYGFPLDTKVVWFTLGGYDGTTAFAAALVANLPTFGDALGEN